MSSPIAWTSRISRRSSPRRIITPVACEGLGIAATSAALLLWTADVHAGPCTEQIAQITQQISHPGLDIGPTGPQTLGAQLHHQPTPSTVQGATNRANADAAAALDQAREADAAGNAAACAKALGEARRLYGIN